MLSWTPFSAFPHFSGAEGPPLAAPITQDPTIVGAGPTQPSLWIPPQVAGPRMASVDLVDSELTTFRH